MDIVNELKLVLLLKVDNLQFSVSEFLRKHRNSLADSFYNLVQCQRSFSYEELVNNTLDSAPLVNFNSKWSVGVVAAKIFDWNIAVVPLCSSHVVVFLTLRGVEDNIVIHFANPTQLVEQEVFGQTAGNFKLNSDVCVCLLNHFISHCASGFFLSKNFVLKPILFTFCVRELQRQHNARFLLFQQLPNLEVPLANQRAFFNLWLFNR